MPRRPAAYPPAYREQIIALARAGKSPKELAQEFEPSEQTIRNWIFQAEADRGERPGAMTSDERAELSRLRRENRQLKVERDIRGKAAAWFARESGTIPSDSSSS
jgi:transposase